MEFVCDFPFPPSWLELPEQAGRESVCVFIVSSSMQRRARNRLAFTNEYGWWALGIAVKSIVATTLQVLNHTSAQR